MNTSKAQNSEFVFFRPRPDGDIDPAGEAGWFLQRQREEAGIKLEDASRAVNIHPYHLSAIEQGDLTGLPPRADALDMIGIYATYLGFDAEPLVKHFAQFLPTQPMPGHRSASNSAPNNAPKNALNKTERKRPAPLSSAKILQFPLMERLASMSAGAGGVVASCLAAVVLFGAASYTFIPGSNTSSNTKIEQIASINTISEQPLPDSGPVNPGQTAKLSIDADKSASELSGLDKLIAKNIADVNIQTASIPASTKTKKATKTATNNVETVGGSQANATGGQVYGTENKNARLILQANANVWVRIEDKRGNVVMTRTLLSGDSYRVPSRNGLVVIARDGGLLSYSIDGAAKGKLGTKGEILVGRPLDLAKLSKKKS